MENKQTALGVEVPRARESADNSSINIIIENFNLFDGLKPAKASFDLIVILSHWQIKIYGCLIIQVLGKPPWLCVPQRRWTDKKTGEKVYLPLIVLPAEVYNQAERTVLAMIAAELAQKPEGDN